MFWIRTEQHRVPDDIITSPAVSWEFSCFSPSTWLRSFLPAAVSTRFAYKQMQQTRPGPTRPDPARVWARARSPACCHVWSALISIWARGRQLTLSLIEQPTSGHRLETFHHLITGFRSRGDTRERCVSMLLSYCLHALSSCSLLLCCVVTLCVSELVCISFCAPL